MPVGAVLVVDDEPHVLQSLARALRETLGIVPETTSDPREALAVLNERPPQVLITDFRMPQIDGVQVLREARRVAPDTVRILLTARAEQANIIAAINEGRIFRFVAKPWDNDHLADVVREALEAHALFTRSPGQALDAENDRQQLRAAVERVGELHQSFCPAGAVRMDTGEAACFAAPYEHASGDYVDVVSLARGRTAVLIGDVAGHGLEAALLGFAARSLLRSGLLEGGDLSSVVEQTNRSLCRDQRGGRFMTLFAGIHDTEQSTLSYVNAGHLSPLLFGAGGMRKLSSTGLPLGLTMDSAYEPPGPVSFLAGDLLFAFTDGLTEARNEAKEFFGDSRVGRQVEATLDLAPADQIAAIRAALKGFAANARAQDDLSLLAYRALPTLLATAREAAVRG